MSAMVEAVSDSISWSDLCAKYRPVGMPYEVVDFSIRRGTAALPPLAIAPIYCSMLIGHSVSSPWPTPDQASWLSLPVKLNVPLEDWMPSTLIDSVSPAASVYSCMMSPPSSTASWPNTQLHETASASSMSSSPCA